MSRVERSTARRGAKGPKVSLNGRAMAVPATYDAVAFAKSITKRQAKPNTTADRLARLAQLEAKHGL